MIDGWEPASLQEVIDLADTFVYGEVVEDDHHAELVSSHVFTKTQAKLKVISDSKNLLTPGEEILISRSAEFDGYQPELKKGMKIIVPVSRNEKHENYSYGFYGFYYVVENKYAVSAFDEAAAGDTNGLTVPALLRRLRRP